MAEFWINIDATSTGWKEADEVWVNIDGTSTGWKSADEVWININGTSTGWKQVFAALTCDDGTLDTLSTTWADTGGLSCASCTSGYCAYCVKLIWTDCTDACHNIDGALSTNGGSYIGSTLCTNKACSNDSGCACVAGGSFQFSCDLTRNCVDQTDSYQGRLILQKDSDSSTVDTIYGTTKTGECLA